jgi:hypothetical protein
LNLIEDLRKKSIKYTLQIPSMSKVWKKWKVEIKEIIGNPPTVTEVLDLGDNLTNILLATSQSGRSQSIVKTAGVVWEGLISYYLNLCLIESRTVVVPFVKHLVPEPIRDTMTVKYGNIQSNSESDLLAITFPKQKEFTGESKETNSKEMKKKIDKLTEEYFSEFELGNIQCKTNWRDNAQTPMLWDMIYHANGFESRNISVGQNNFDIKSLKKFSYSFVTVPTGDKPAAGSMPVKRVQNISGGNYWGLESQNGVCNSIKEIFNKNFSGGKNKSLREDLKVGLDKLDLDYSYFDLE